MPTPARILYISHLFPRVSLPEYGSNAHNAAIRVGADILVLTRKLPEPLVQTPPSVRIQQIPYPDSHLQLLANNMIMSVAGFIRSLAGQLLLAIKAIIPARAYRPDIIHSFGALTLPAAYVARLVTGAPVIVSLHGTDFHRINKSNFLIWWVRLADTIICVSQHMVVALQKKMPEKPIYYCPSGVDLTVFRNDPPLPRENIIVCVGRLTSVKRYDRILDAFAKIIQKSPEYRLIIMGRGDLLNVLQQQAERLQISDLVKFGGVVEKTELAKILRTAKLFLMASDWEGTPKALLEAMACGIPVVTTDVGDCSYLVQGAGRVVMDNSPDAIALAALDVIRSSNWDDFSRRAVSNASQFSWIEVTNKLKQVYRTLNSGVYL